jgi:hypothetical protein
MEREQKITLGEMREQTRSLLVYCADFSCSHSVELPPAEVDQWPDSVRLSDLEPRFTCQRCGKRGADVRPNYAPTKMGTVFL